MSRYYREPLGADTPESGLSPDVTKQVDAAMEKAWAETKGNPEETLKRVFGSEIAAEWMSDPSFAAAVGTRSPAAVHTASHPPAAAHPAHRRKARAEAPAHVGRPAVPPSAPPKPAPTAAAVTPAEHPSRAHGWLALGAITLGVGGLIWIMRGSDRRDRGTP